MYTRFRTLEEYELCSRDLLHPDNTTTGSQIESSMKILGLPKTVTS